MTEKQDQAAALSQQVSAALPMAKELRRAGWSFARIAEHLDSEGVPTPSRWKGKPSRWNYKSVKRLLDQAGSGDRSFAPEEQAAPEEQIAPEEQTASHIRVTAPITVTAPGVAITLTGFTGPVKVSGPFNVDQAQPLAEEAASAKESSIIKLTRLTMEEISQAMGPPPGLARRCG